MVASFDAQHLAHEENLKLAKLMVTYEDLVCFALPMTPSVDGRSPTAIDGEPINEEAVFDAMLSPDMKHLLFWRPPMTLLLLLQESLLMGSLYLMHGCVHQK